MSSNNRIDHNTVYLIFDVEALNNLGIKLMVECGHGRVLMIRAVPADLAAASFFQPCESRA